MKNIYWQISQRKITIFSIIVIPDLKKRKIFWKNISSYRIAKISHLYTKWNVLQQIKYARDIPVYFGISG